MSDALRSGCSAIAARVTGSSLRRTGSPPRMMISPPTGLSSRAFASRPPSVRAPERVDAPNRPGRFDEGRSAAGAARAARGRHEEQAEGGDVDCAYSILGLRAFGSPVLRLLDGHDFPAEDLLDLRDPASATARPSTPQTL